MRWCTHWTLALNWPVVIVHDLSRPAFNLCTEYWSLPLHVIFIAAFFPWNTKSSRFWYNVYQSIKHYVEYQSINLESSSMLPGTFVCNAFNWWLSGCVYMYFMYVFPYLCLSISLGNLSGYSFIFKAAFTRTQILLPPKVISLTIYGDTARAVPGKAPHSVSSANWDPQVPHRLLYECQSMALSTIPHPCCIPLHHTLSLLAFPTDGFWLHFTAARFRDGLNGCISMQIADREHPIIDVCQFCTCE